MTKTAFHTKILQLVDVFFILFDLALYILSSGVLLVLLTSAEALYLSESPEWSSAKTFIFLSELACNSPYEADLKLLAKKTDSCRKL